MNFLSEFNIFNFSKRIKRPLILDGAMGSLLEKKGLTANNFAWSAKANIKYPEKVLQIHKDYIFAGADIITTNTFRTNPYSLQSAGIKDYKKYVKKAVELAKEAKKNLPIFIAGSNAPAEDCYQVQRTISRKQLELNHSNHIEALVEYGCHFILNETQSHFDEIKIISKYCERNNIPYVISLFFDENLNLLSGEKVTYVTDYLSDSAVLAVGYNCISDKLLLKLINQNNLYKYWGFYLNCFGKNAGSEKVCSISVADYLVTIQEVINFNPAFIGACCGSNPEFIKAIKSFLDGRIKH